MGKQLKSSFELAMERLKATESKETKTISLNAKQKEEIAEARRAASARLAEREILYKDALKRMVDPAERAKAENEYQVDRKRIEDDCERKVNAIRKG